MPLTAARCGQQQLCFTRGGSRHIPSHHRSLVHTHDCIATHSTWKGRLGLPHIVLQCFALFSASRAQHDPTRAHSLPWLRRVIFRCAVVACGAQRSACSCLGKHSLPTGRLFSLSVETVDIATSPTSTRLNCTEIALVWHPAPKSLLRTEGCAHVGTCTMDDISDVNLWGTVLLSAHRLCKDVPRSCTPCTVPPSCCAPSSVITNGFGLAGTVTAPNSSQWGRKCSLGSARFRRGASASVTRQPRLAPGSIAWL